MAKEDNIIYLVFGILIFAILLLAIFAIRSYINQMVVLLEPASSFASTAASEYFATVS
jgi:hypothetical protein